MNITDQEGQRRFQNKERLFRSSMQFKDKINSTDILPKAKSLAFNKARFG